MKANLESRLGIFVAITLLALLLLIEFAGGLAMFRDRIEVGARFTDVHDLKPGAQVRMAGVVIGRVEAIGFEGNQVRVGMEIDSDKAPSILTDSVASVQFQGLMGQNYISIEFGDQGAPIQTGTELATRAQPNINSLIDRISGVAGGIEKVTEGFSDDKFTDVLGPLADFVMNNKDHANDIIADLKDTIHQISEGQGTVGRLIFDDDLYREATNVIAQLRRQSDNMEAVLTEARSLVQGVREGEGTLGRLATDQSLFEEGRLAMVELKEILQKINRGEGSIGILVNESSLIQNARAALQKVEKATEGLEDQGPLSVLGLVVGRLF